MTTTRRHFLASAAGAGVLAAQNVSPNDRVRIALIGAGGQGSGDTRNALNVGGVELAAVADIYDGRLKRAREVWGEQVFTTRDYREVLARKDVDAVFVATPDHWHSAIAIDAMNAGKDVYCEKPMVQQLSQGAQMWGERKFARPVVSSQPAAAPGNAPAGFRGSREPFRPVGPEGTVEMDAVRPFVGKHSPRVKLAGAD